MVTVYGKKIESASKRDRGLHAIFVDSSTSWSVC